jgi:hypothetical protein
VLDGGPRLFADRIIWQPKSDHPEKEHGGLQRRRKDKHKDDEEDEEDDRGGKHGHGKHGDDEDEDDTSKSKHWGDEETEDDYTSSASGKNGKSRHGDEADGDDGYSSKSNSRYADDEESYPKSKPSSKFDDDDEAGSSTGTKSSPKSKFDDGQYRPSAYANSGADDCATLSSFYVSMKGETWSPPVDWSASAVSTPKGAASCCTWTGITCDAYERVIGLDVSSLGLSGALGSELFSLDALLRL